MTCYFIKLPEAPPISSKYRTPSHCEGSGAPRVECSREGPCSTSTTAKRNVVPSSGWERLPACTCPTGPALLPPFSVCGGCCHRGLLLQTHFLPAQSKDSSCGATGPWKRPVHLNNWQWLPCMLAQPCALWSMSPYRQWGWTQCLQRGRALEMAIPRSLHGHAAPSSSWAAPVPSSQGREAMVWVQGWGFILQRWGVSGGGDWQAGSSSTRVWQDSMGEGHFQGVAEVLKSVPMAPGMTQDHCCTQQFLK